MATGRNISGITLTIGGDTTGLNRALKDVNKNISSTQSQLKDVERLLKLDPSNTELLAQKQQLLSKAVQDTRQKLETLKTAEQQAQQQFAEGHISQEQYDALRREIIATEQQLENLEQQAEEANVTLQRISIAGDRMQEFGGKVTEVGKKLSVVSAAVAGVGIAAVKTTADFDESMSKVAAISGAAGEEFDDLRDKAREMGAKTKFSASEAADAFQYMAMAGWKTEDMMSGIEGIMNLAAASGEDLAQTSDIVTDALTAFGLTAEDSGHFADVLAAASSNANTNVSMMGETFKYVAPVAGSMGYAAEDMAVAIGLMANSGIKASQAGTQLRTSLVNMVKPTDAMASVMDKYGISLTDNEGNLKSFADVTDMLRDKLKVTTEEEVTQNYAMAEQELLTTKLGSAIQAATDDQKKYLIETGKGMDIYDHLSEKETKAAAQKYLGIDLTKKRKLSEEEYYTLVQGLGQDSLKGMTAAEQENAAATLFGKEAMSGMLAVINASEGDYDKLTDAVQNCDGVTQEMADTMQDNLNGQLTILKSQLQELAIKIGDALMPMIRSLVTSIQKLVDKFNGMSDTQKRVVVIVGMVVAALGPLLIIIGQIATGIGALMSVATAIGSVLAFLAASGGPLIVLTVAFAALYQTLDIVTASTGKCYKEAKTLTEEERQHVDQVDKLKEAYEQMDQQRGESMENIQSEAQYQRDIFDELKNITDENGKVKEGYEDRAKVIAGQLSDALGTEIKLTDDQIDNYQELCANLDKLIQKKQAEALLDANQAAYTEAIQKKNDALSAYLEAQKDVKNATDELNQAEEEHKKICEEQSKVLEEAKEKGIEPDAAALRDLSKAWEESAGKVSGYKEKLGELTTNLQNAEEVYTGYNTTIANYEGLSAAIISGDQQKIDDAILRTTNNFQAAETSTKECLERQHQDFVKKYDEMKEAVDDGATWISQTQIDQMKKLVDDSQKELDRLPELMKQAGKDTALGYANGIDVMLGYAASAAKRMGQSSLDGAREALDSHSPSRKTYAIGGDFDQGFANGITGHIGMIITAVTNGFSEAVSFVSSLPQKAATWGSDFISGFVGALQSKIGEVKKATKGVADTISSYLHFTRPDKGPLRNYEEWMPHMIEGMSKGLNDNIWRITDQLQSITSRISLTMDTNSQGSNTDLTKIEGLLDYYLPTMKGANIVLDDGILVGKMTPQINARFSAGKETQGRNG